MKKTKQIRIVSIHIKGLLKPQRFNITACSIKTVFLGKLSAERER